MSSQFNLWFSDCLEVLRHLPDESVDAVLTDPPYGTTGCKWDSVIPLDAMWEQLWRVSKPDAPVILHAAQPFTSRVVMSNVENYKHAWRWVKDRPSNPQLAKICPLRYDEDVLVFCRGRLLYKPQGLREIPIEERKVHNPEKNSLGHCKRKPYVQTHTGYPDGVLRFPSERGLHPTQKPVPLAAYLLRTYTEPGAVVLDFTMGSGTTGVACAVEGRSFIGIESDAGYFETASNRIRAAYAGEKAA